MGCLQGPRIALKYEEADSCLTLSPPSVWVTLRPRFPMGEEFANSRNSPSTDA